MPRSAPRHDRDAGGPADVLAAKAALREQVWSAMRAAKVARLGRPDRGEDRGDPAAASAASRSVTDPGAPGDPGAPDKAILIDLGGVLVPDYLPAAAAEWGAHLGISPQAFLAALFGGSDDQVLTGRVSEPRWWAVVAGRLRAGPGLMAELQQDLASRQVWDSALVAYLRRLRGRARTAIVSNAWPGTRATMSRAGMLDIAGEIVLSSEIGYAKPDPRIYTAALRRLAVGPGRALFIDDTAGHVTAAESLGIAGHVHASTAGTIARIEHFLQPEPGNR